MTKRERKMFGLCIDCGEPVNDSRYIRCQTCRNNIQEENKRMEHIRKEKKERSRFKPKVSLEERNEQAREHGMSYGQYMAMLYMKKLKGESDEG